ncbi:MAG: hypothetical protein OEU26_33535 [Candidatus Tectomicrobia bacterium]|nr:hypothetical protein [Candidatus Tectomicrobia bacterium]
MYQMSVFRYILFLMFKHKYKILLTTLTALALVMWVTSRSQYLYEASASILVKFRSDYMPPHAASPPQGQVQAERQGRISNEIEILTSHDLIEQVIATSGVGHLYPELVRSPLLDATFVGKATLTFREHLRVRQVDGSDVIRVAFQHRHPRIASEVVNLMIQLYQNKHQQTFSTPTAVTFLQSQVERHRQSMQETEEELEQFKRTSGTHSLEEERSLMLRQRAELQTSHNAIQSQRVALEEKLGVMKDQHDTVAGPEETRTGQAISALERAQSRLLQLRREERELLKIFKDGHPKLIQLRQTIRAAKVALRQEQTRQGRVESGRSRPLAEVESDILRDEAELRALGAQSVALKAQSKDLDEQLLALTRQEKGLHTLQRQLATHEQNYRTAVAKLEEARLAEEMNRRKSANISVIEPAVAPIQTVGAGKEITLAAGLLLGMVVGLGVAFCAERMSQRLSTPADVERRLGLPVLTAVPQKRVRSLSLTGMTADPQRLLPEHEASPAAVPIVVE